MTESEIIHFKVCPARRMPSLLSNAGVIILSETFDSFTIATNCLASTS